MPIHADELRLLRRDLRRYSVLLPAPTFRRRFRQIVTTEGIWYICSYRIGRWVRREVHVPVLRQALKAATLLLHTALTCVTKMDISFDTEIGAGLYIGHAGYLIVNADAVIGENCNLSPGVVIGEGGRAGARGTPILGRNVYVAPGAKIFGGIRVGDNVAIGANAVVYRSVPSNAVIAGNPGRIVSYHGSADFVIVADDDFDADESEGPIAVVPQQS
jgi:serine O-acetyltransferase